MQSICRDAIFSLLAKTLSFILGKLVYAAPAFIAVIYEDCGLKNSVTISFLVYFHNCMVLDLSRVGHFLFRKLLFYPRYSTICGTDLNYGVAH